MDVGGVADATPSKAHKQKNIEDRIIEIMMCGKNTANDSLGLRIIKSCELFVISLISYMANVLQKSN